MKQILALIIFIFMSTGLLNNNVSAQEIDVNYINELADEALNFAKTNRFDEAKNIIQTINDILNSHYILTADESRILQSSFNEVIRSLDHDSINEEHVLRNLTKYRLVVDAVFSEHMPLWGEMEDSVLTAFQTLKDAYHIKDNDLFIHELKGFLSIYDLIYTSIVLDVPIEKVQKIDAQIQYLEQNAQQIFISENGIETMEAIQMDLENLFEGTEEDEADPSLWWVIISTGGIIVLTLTYVGWRKYKAEKERKSRYKKTGGVFNLLCDNYTYPYLC